MEDDKPVKLTVAFPAALHRNRVVYAEILSRETGRAIEPTKLIEPMLEKFIASDSKFVRERARRSTEH